MTIVTEYDWESDTWTHHTGENAARTVWREAVQEIADKAKATLPDCAGRVDRAVAIVLNHDVEDDKEQWSTAGRCMEDVWYDTSRHTHRHHCWIGMPVRGRPIISAYGYWRGRLPDQ